MLKVFGEEEDGITVDGYQFGVIDTHRDDIEESNPLC